MWIDVENTSKDEKPAKDKVSSKKRKGGLSEKELAQVAKTAKDFGMTAIIFTP